MRKILSEVKSFIKTIFFFNLACWLSPILLFTYICVRFTHNFYISVLNARYPCYEFSRTKKIRSLIDTTRNPGIFNFLLQVNGTYDFEKIKEFYTTNLIEKRLPSGELTFPKLRQKLLTCWGHYAWDKDDSDFDINNHIVLKSTSYRGGSVSNNNLQDFISDLVAKYISLDIPPWQVIVIPVSSTESSSEATEDVITEEKYYLLIRVHHLIMAEETNLHLGQLLMLNLNGTLKVTNIGIEAPKFYDFIEGLEHIPKLWTHIKASTTTTWNEFIYRYDPLESPDIDNKLEVKNIMSLISILLITIVTVATEFIGGYKKTKVDSTSKIQYLINLIQRETKKRNLSTKCVLKATILSLNPFNVIKETVITLWWFFIMYIVLLPYYIIREIRAALQVVLTGRTDIENSYSKLLTTYVPLIYRAILECLNILCEIIRTPRNIFEELFQSPSKEGNILQIKSYCGRKVVSFSKPIDMDEIVQRINLDKIEESSFILSCLGGSLLQFLKEFKNFEVPNQLNVTCRALDKGYLTDRNNKTAYIGGVVFMQLPLEKPSKAHIDSINKIINRVRSKQLAIYILSLAQTKFDALTSLLPEVWIKILINYFSIYFPVTITEIFGDTTKFKTSWGHSVQDILLFRPPQSKTCLSLNIHRFDRTTRLAVMADSELAPDHFKLTKFWEVLMERKKM